MIDDPAASRTRLSMRAMRWVVPLTLLGLAARVAADPTDLDQSFGQLGATTTSVQAVDMQARTLVPLPDGGYVVVGTGRDTVGGDSMPRHVVLVAYTADGVPDASVANGGLGPGVIAEFSAPWLAGIPGLEVLAVQLGAPPLRAAVYHERNGVPGIVVAVAVRGRDSQLATERWYTALLRFPLEGLRLGNLDPDFGAGGFVLLPPRQGDPGIRSRLALATDDAWRIYQLWGVTFTTSVTQPSGQSLLRWNADGTADTTWGNAGELVLTNPINGPGDDLRVLADGRALFVGKSLSTGNVDLAFARFTSGGAPDTTFGTNGLATVRRGGGEQNLLALALDWSGRIVFAGRRTAASTGYIGRLTANGGLDTTFAAGLGSTDGFYDATELASVCGVLPQPDGRLIVGRSSGFAVDVVRFLADLADADASFANFQGSAEWVAVHPDWVTTSGDFFAPCAGLHLDALGRIVVAAGRMAVGGPGDGGNDFSLLRLRGGDLVQVPGGVLRFTDDAGAVAENAGSITLTVRRDSGTAGAVAVDYRTGPETATEGADYTATVGVLEFADGEIEQTITVPISDDDVFEPAPRETFRVELFNATGGAVLGTASVATVGIADDDGGYDLALSGAADVPTPLGNGLYRTTYRIRVANQWTEPSPERRIQIYFPDDVLDFESAESVLTVNGDAFGYYDAVAHVWTVPTLYLNVSSAELRLQVTHALASSLGDYVTVAAEVLDNAADIFPANDRVEVVAGFGGDDLVVTLAIEKATWKTDDFIPFDVRVSRVPLDTPPPIYATGVVLELELRADGPEPQGNTAFVPERVTGATCTLGNEQRTLVCPLGDLSPTSPVLPIDIRVEASGESGRTVRLTATLTADTFDPVLDNNENVVLAVTIETATYTADPKQPFDPFCNDSDRDAGRCSGELTPLWGVCGVTAAATGTWMEQHLGVLRAFRNRWLLTNAPGRAFTSWYYRVSPTIVRWISARGWALAAARVVLAPVILLFAYPLASVGLLLSPLAAFGTRRALRRRQTEAQS